MRSYVLVPISLFHLHILLERACVRMQDTSLTVQHAVHKERDHSDAKGELSRSMELQKISKSDSRSSVSGRQEQQSNGKVEADKAPSPLCSFLKNNNKNSADTSDRSSTSLHRPRRRLSLQR
jgi:hypothetical protein